MLDGMPILSATPDYYFKLSKIDVNTIKTLHAIIFVIEGIIGAYHYYTIVEVEYGRLHALLNSKKTMSCLKYLECLAEQLKSYADWSYRAKLDYEKIREEEMLSTLKRVEANLDNLIKQFEQSPRKEGHES